MVRFAKVSATHATGAPGMSYTISINRSTCISVVLAEPRPATIRSLRGIIIAQNCENQFMNWRSAYGFFSGLIFARFPILEHFDNIHVLDQSLLTEAPFFDFGDV